MEVLKRCKLALRLGNLSNKRGFYLFNWKVSNFIVDFFLLLPMSICVIQMLIFCSEIGPNLKEISSSIYLGLGILSIGAMYISLAAKNDLIIETLDHLQEMVNLSKFVFSKGFSFSNIY